MLSIRENKGVKIFNNKTSPLLKTPEKDFHLLSLFEILTTVLLIDIFHFTYSERMF